MGKKREYMIGKYADNFGPGKAGLYYIECTSTEVIALTETESQAVKVVNAMKVSDASPQ